MVSCTASTTGTAATRFSVWWCDVRREDAVGIDLRIVEKAVCGLKLGSVERLRKPALRAAGETARQGNKTPFQTCVAQVRSAETWVFAQSSISFSPANLVRRYKQGARKLTLTLRVYKQFFSRQIPKMWAILKGSAGDSPRFDLYDGRRDSPIFAKETGDHR